MQLKDSCLSFALFWLLLGKFWSYPLYKQGSNSRVKAWKLVRYGLLADVGEHERVFRVIEVELAFLRDYLHAKYIYYYLNGFHRKLISVLAFPVMFWWFTQKAIDYETLKGFAKQGYGDPNFTEKANTIVIAVILALEVVQLVLFLTSRWLKVTLLCYYVERKTSKKKAGLSSWLLEIIGSTFLGSSCTSSTNTWWRKPWKRELGQYSLLVQSCTGFPKAASCLHLVATGFGISLPKPGRKQDDDLVLPEQVKEAVVLSLQGNGLKLSNGAASLRRNGVMKELSWACKLENETDIILVWHIATSFCEMHPTSQEENNAQSTKEFEVATSLSKYCAYLFFFASSLLPVHALEADSICDTVIEETRTLFNKPVFACGKTSETALYEKMMELISDKEIGDSRSSVLASGAKLGNDLVTLVKDQGKRWKILAEFWAELMLFLAPSNGNEMAHAEKLSEGGEFITHLWALLIHSGITDRDDMAAFQQDESKPDVPSV